MNSLTSKTDHALANRDTRQQQLPSSRAGVSEQSCVIRLTVVSVVVVVVVEIAARAILIWYTPKIEVEDLES